MKINKAFPIAVIGLMTSLSLTAQFKKTVISRDFISEGVAAADLNHDGKLDIIAGYYWFEAPHWQKHEMAPSRSFDPRQEYSESFLNMALDVNLDGWDDVVIIDYPGKSAFWFENPHNKDVQWKKHFIADSMGVGNESPAFVDINKDGRLDILCADVQKKQIVWLESPSKKNQIHWTRHALSHENVSGTERFSHGIGWGDINMDGIEDVVITTGWFEGKKDLSSGDWKFHKTNLGEACSHMQVLDINGDGKNDVLSSSAHSVGVWWHEQVSTPDGIDFKTHLINTTTYQTHATIMADLTGDGKAEFVTGKRYLAHNGRDKGDAEAPLIYYLELQKEAPYFKEVLIDDDSGVGLNITAKDMNNDGRIDLVIANKNGVFLLENK